MSETYRVVTRGIKEGFANAQAADMLAFVFKRTKEEIQPILDSKGVVVKKGIDLPTAMKYRAALEQCGCLCAIEPDAVTGPADADNQYGSAWSDANQFARQNQIELIKQNSEDGDQLPLPGQNGKSIQQQKNSSQSFTIVPESSSVTSASAGLALAGWQPRARSEADAGILVLATMNAANTDSGGAAKVPARGEKREDGDDRKIGQIASGQRLLILSIAGSYLFSNISKDLNFAWAIFFLLAVFVMTTTGWLRLAKGLRLAPLSRALLLLACYLPVVNLVVLVVMNRRANRRLRDAGYKVGLFGAGEAIPPSHDMRNILVGALALTLPVYGLQQEIEYEYHKHGLAAVQSGLDPAGTILKQAEQDYFMGKTTAARDALTNLAQAGNTTAMQRLGLLYMWGLGGNRDNFIDSDTAGISRDHKQGMYWLRKAAALGNTEAQVSLGAVYELGLGEERDYSTAADWYRQAAQNNDCVGQVSLAWLYGSGQGVPKDFTIAYMLLDLAQRRYEASQECFGEYRWLLKGTAGPYPFTTAAIQGDKDNLINKRLGHSGFDAAGDLRNLIVLMAPVDVARGKALAAAWKPGDPLQ